MPTPGSRSLYPAMVGAHSLAIITTVVIARRRRCPGWMIGWFWFLGTLVPMIGLFQVGTQQRADRYLYFPMLGLLLALTAHLPWDRWQAVPWRRWLWRASIVLIGLLAWRAWDQAATCATVRRSSSMG